MIRCTHESVTRRHFFRECGVGVGKIALAGLLTDAFTGELVRLARPQIGHDPLAPKAPHFAPKAKRVIHLFMAGAPSQLDLFDSKPALTKLEGKPLPPSVIGGQRYAFIRPDAAVLGPAVQVRQVRPERRRALGDAAAPGPGRRRDLPSSSRFTPTSSTMRRPRSS